MRGLFVIEPVMDSFTGILVAAIIGDEGRENKDVGESGEGCVSIVECKRYMGSILNIRWLSWRPQWKGHSTLVFCWT